MKAVTSNKKICDIKTGTHLVTICDMFYLKDAANNIQKIDGFPAIVVRFKDGQNNTHDQVYVIDGGKRQKHFQTLLKSAQVNTEGSPKKSDVLGKRLWASINELHFVEDDEPLPGPDGGPRIEHYIFKVYPYIENQKAPILPGDPAHNDGIASGDFVTYKNLSLPEKEEVVPKENATTSPEEPSF